MICLRVPVVGARLAGGACAAAAPGSVSAITSDITSFVMAAMLPPNHEDTKDTKVTIVVFAPFASSWFVTQNVRRNPSCRLRGAYERFVLDEGCLYWRLDSLVT